MKRVAGFRVLKSRMGTKVEEEPLLFHALQNEQDDWATGAMANALRGESTDRLFLPALHSILLDNRRGPQSVIGTLYAIGRIGDSSSVQVIARILERAKESSVLNGTYGVSSFTHALGEIGSPAALPVLRKLALVKVPDAPRYTYAYLVVDALGMIGDPSGVDIALSVLKGPHIMDHVEADAIDSLGNMKATWTAGIIHPYLNPQKDENARIAAAGALGKLLNPGSLPYLVRAVQSDDSWEVRRVAARGLGKFKSFDTVESLGGVLLKDTHHLVRQTAAQALGVIGGSRSKTILKSALISEKNEMVFSAIRVSLELIR